MTRTKSGIIFMAFGVAANIAGRLWLKFHPFLPTVAALQALLMIASVVLFLFGLFRVIAGLVGRKKKAETAIVALGEDTVWPPAPKPPTSVS